MAYNTKPIVTDKDGNPISQYYNPDTDQYEPVNGAGGGNAVILYNEDGTPNNSLSLIPILEKLEQLTGSVIDEQYRQVNEVVRLDNEQLRIQLYDDLLAELGRIAQITEQVPQSVLDELANLSDKIGDLQDLTTGEKTNLIAAINEIVQNMGGGTAVDIDYDNTESELAAENVQEAIDEVNHNLGSHEAETATLILDFTDLQEAVLSATPLTCNIGRQIDITENITIPKDFVLKFNNDGKLNIASGVTVTINGYIDAGHKEVFIGDGTVNGNIQNDRLIANWFGVVRDAGLKIDQTVKIAKFLSIANTTNTEAHFLKGHYYFNEMDLSIFVNKGGITITGEGKHSEYNSTQFHCLDKTKIVNPVGAFIFVNNGDLLTTNRNITILDITILDDDVTITNYGLYAQGVAFANLDNILIYGFKTSMFLGTSWNCEYGKIDLYYYTEYGLHIGSNSVNNASTFSKLHCSSSKNAIANIYCDSNRSCIFYELTTEGNATTHVLFEQGNESFIVFGWHVEGGKNLFDIKGFTNRYSNIEIYGANIHLGADSALTDSRLFLFTDCTGLGGVGSLTMRGSLRLQPTTHADYLSLNRIYNSDIMLTFNENEPAIDFINIGSALHTISTTIVTCDIRPIGYHYAKYPLRKGIAGTASNSYFKAASAMNGVPTLFFKHKEDRGTKCLYYEVNLYLTSDSTSTSEFAKFMVGISENGTLTQTEISSNGVNAKNVIFTWDNIAQALYMATNHSTGYYTIDITERIARI